MSCVQAVGNQAVEKGKQYYNKEALLSILVANQCTLSISRSTRKKLWQFKIWNFNRAKYINKLTKLRRSSKTNWPSVLCTNLRSLRNKFDEVHETVIQHKCDLNVFTETWLNDEYNSCLLSIPGYSIVRLDRKVQKGGGILVYKRLGLNSEAIQFDNPNKREILPFILPQHNNLFICIYHPFWQEKSIHDEVIDLFFQIISKAQSSINGMLSITIVGDFNGLKEFMAPVCKTFNLKNFVTFPTRGSSTLDCCFSSKRCNYSCTQLSPLGQSDHKIFICRSQQRSTKFKFKEVLVRDFSPKNKSVFFYLITSSALVTPPTITDGISLNFAYDTFISTLSSLLDYCFPMKKIRVSENLPWISNNIRLLIRKRNNAARHGNSQKFKHYRSKVKLAIRKAKIYYSSSINNASNKQNWERVKEVINIRSKKQSHAKPPLSSQELLDFFTSVRSSEDPQLLTNDINSNHKDQSIALSEEEVVQSLRKSKKGGGVPFLPPWLLQNYADLLAKPLRPIFEASLNLGIIPSHLKMARITPIPKIKTPKAVSDFRPITCVSPILKALERIVMDKWLKHLITKEHFQDQFAFVPLKGRGCTSALTFIYGNLVQSIDHGLYSNLLMIDFSKAFDRVSSFQIANNLLSLGASQQCVYWIFNFMQNRHIQVAQNSDVSSFVSISGGTPQGSIISPILFAIACFTLKPTTTSCQYIKYADDLTVLHTFHNDPSSTDLQTEVDSINIWATKNSMKINELKTKLIHVSGRKSRRPPAIFINNSEIEIVSSARLLGLTLTSDLKWNTNTTNSINSASKVFYHIVLLKRTEICPKVLYNIYCALVRPLLTYSCPTTINMTQYNQKQLLKCERRFLSIIKYTNVEKLDSFTNRISQKFVQTVTNNADHPFRQLLITLPKSRTRSERTLVASNGRTSLKKNSIIKYFK